MVIHTFKICFLILLFASCRIGWHRVDTKMKLKRNRTEAIIYSNLPDDVKLAINKKKGLTINQGSVNNLDTSNICLNKHFEVSADYTGFIFRKMGDYLKINGVKYFINYKNGSPIISYNNAIYYTKDFAVYAKPDSIKNNIVYYKYELKN